MSPYPAGPCPSRYAASADSTLLPPLREKSCRNSAGLSPPHAIEHPRHSESSVSLHNLLFTHFPGGNLTILFKLLDLPDDPLLSLLHIFQRYRTQRLHI